MTAQSVGTLALVVAGLAIGIGAFVALSGWMQSRISEAVRTASEQLGLRADPALDGVFCGELDGMRVTVGPASKIVAVQGKGASISWVAIVAAFPRPLPFALRMAKLGWPAPHTMRLEDPQFDRHCAISTDNPDAVRRILASPEIRERVSRFLQSGPGGNAEVLATGVSTKIFDAHVKGAPKIVQSVRSAVDLARVISAEARK